MIFRQLLKCRYAHTVCAITGIEASRHCRYGYVFTPKECPAGHITNIESVEFKHIELASNYWNNSQCYLLPDICQQQARKHIQDIINVRCNGRRRCNFSAFGQNCQDNTSMQVSAIFVKIGYNCINGIRTHFMICLFTVILLLQFCLYVSNAMRIKAALTCKIK